MSKKTTTKKTAAKKTTTKKTAAKKTSKKTTKKTAAKKTTKKEEKSSRRTVSSVARELIRQGQTNAQIWKALDEEFAIGETKKHYPSWYRSKMVRDGELTKAQAYPRS